MIKARALVLAVVVAACGGGSGPSKVTPTNSARGAVDAFMQAVADSNLTQMANLWGTAAGPAAKTRQPADWERRIAVMQAYLQNESHRVVSDGPATPAAEGRRAVQVEIRRQLCTWTIPFTAVKLGDGSWIVNQVDLTAAGNPARPCVPGQDTAAGAARQE
ncbi:MAG TPA: hypothetical protein VH764_16235 [Gemmatimonadales bacterium]